MTQPYAARTHQEMQDVLMNPDASGPAIHYYMIRGGTKKTNITVWEPGTVGGEYIKAYGHYHRDAIEETYTVLRGEGYIIIQERALNASGEPIDHNIKNVRAIYVKAGDSVSIPPLSGHLAVNTGPSWLVTCDDSPVNFDEQEAVSKPSHADYEPFKRLQGAAYYVISKDGKPEFVKNPRYKIAPPIVFQ